MDSAGPSEGSIFLQHELLGVMKTVRNVHLLDIKLDGVLGKSSVHPGALELVLGVSVRADRGGEELIVEFLEVPEPVDLTAAGAVLQNKVAENVADVGVLLAGTDHADAKGLVVESDILVFLEKTFLDAVGTVAVLKETDGGKVPACATIFLIVARCGIWGSELCGDLITSVVMSGFYGTK